MKPFNLEEALQGAPCLTRNGRTAFVKAYMPESVDSQLAGVVIEIDGEIRTNTWTSEGYSLSKKSPSHIDLVSMWEGPKLAFDHWDMIHSDINYIAKDLFGGWFCYTSKPVKNEECDSWKSSDVFGKLWIRDDWFPDCDWENSLIRRPE